MTTIIISILAALGIGGGVMLASSGGGSSSGGAAVVAPVNPGSGGSNASATMGTVNWGDDSNEDPNCSPGFGFNGGSGGSGNSITVYLNGDPNLPAIAGNLLKNTPGSAITTNDKRGKAETSLNGSNLKIFLNLWRPVPIADNNFNLSEENPASYRSWGNHRYVFNYSNYYTTVIFNLGTRTGENTLSDTYSVSIYPTDIAHLSANYLLANGNSTSVKTENRNNLKWNLDATLALGGRQLNLQNSDFGYVTWKSYFTGPGVSNNQFYTKWGIDQMYWFNTSRQLTNYNRYSSTNNIAEFNGKVIGAQHLINNINGTDSITDVTGNIALTLNFANNSLSGTLSNMKVGNTNWYTFGLEGNINNITSTNPNNFKITNITYNNSFSSNLGQSQLNFNNSELKALMSDNSFGHGSIVTGSSISQDESVGEIAFLGASKNFEQGNILIYTNLAFGAKKQ